MESKKTSLTNSKLSPEIIEQISDFKKYFLKIKSKDLTSLDTNAFISQLFAREIGEIFFEILQINDENKAEILLDVSTHFTNSPIGIQIDTITNLILGKRQIRERDFYLLRKKYPSLEKLMLKKYQERLMMKQADLRKSIK